MHAVKRIRIALLILLALALVVPAAASGSGGSGGGGGGTSTTGASFQPLGLGPAGAVQSFAWDVSADGSVVVGTSWVQDGAFFPPHAVRWVSGTVQDLGALNPNAHEAQALAVSDDGTKAVGWARGTSGFQRPFLWTASGGMQELPNVPGSDAIATDISRDGSVIVGRFYVDAEGSWHAFRWSGGVVTDLGFLPSGGRDSEAGAVCGLGAAVVGSTVDSTTIQRAFRWRAGSSMQNLGGVGKNSLAYAKGCSDDGNVVAGTSMDDKGNLRATRWDASSPRDLGTLGGDMSEAHAISSDGSVVVGGAGLPFVNGISEFSAFRWTTATGKIEQLSRVLQNAGVTTPFCHAVPCPAGTWFLQLALGVSANGSVVVGFAIDPNGAAEAYRAVLPTTVK
jgi:probable HAF family extracellular repeat protein